MKALRSQMNPHFISTLLQSIQTFLIGTSRRSESCTSLKFKAKLIRSVLENAQRSEVPLRVDIQTLELYMQLENIRLKYSLNTISS